MNEVRYGTPYYDYPEWIKKQVRNCAVCGQIPCIWLSGTSEPHDYVAIFMLCEKCRAKSSHRHLMTSSDNLEAGPVLDECLDLLAKAWNRDNYEIEKDAHRTI